MASQPNQNFSNCHICGAPPTQNKEHCYHYGGISCINCKAFFKYCIDKQLVSPDGKVKYNCKQNKPGSCFVTHAMKSKELCKHCRYLKCLAAGMDSSMILKGEERKKYDHSKKKKEKSIKGHFGSSLPVISEAYQLSFKEVFLDEETFRILFHGHCSEVEWSERHSDALVKVLNIHTACIVHMMIKLNNHQDFYQQEADLKKMIEKNTCLFMYYILARYFMAPDGLTQLCWILGSKTEDFLKEGKQRAKLKIVSFFEVNQWSHLFPCTNRKKLHLFSHCVEAVQKYFAFEPSLTPIIGYKLTLAKDHSPVSDQILMSDYQGIKPPKELLGMGTTTDETSGQLEFLFHNLTTMSLIAFNESLSNKQIGIKQPSTEDCTTLECQWAEHSLDQLKRIFEDNQIDCAMINSCIDHGVTGKIDMHMDQKAHMANLFKRRFDLFLSQFGGNVMLSSTQFARVFTFFYFRVALFDRIQDCIQWAMGTGTFEMDLDLPNFNLYNCFKDMGVFVHKKREALHFKQVTEELMNLARVDETVPDLFLVSLILDNVGRLYQQQQFQRVLVKKLSQHTDRLNVESGDEALCKMQYLFSNYLSICSRLASGISEDVQQQNN